jgi:hypothetical protein
MPIFQMLPNEEGPIDARFLPFRYSRENRSKPIAFCAVIVHFIFYLTLKARYYYSKKNALLQSPREQKLIHFGLQKWHHPVSYNEKLVRQILEDQCPLSAAG